MAYDFPRRRTSSNGSFSSLRSPPMSPSPFAMLGPGSLSSMPPAQQSQIFGSIGLGKLRKSSSTKAPTGSSSSPKTSRSSRAPPVPSIPYNYRPSPRIDSPPAYSRNPTTTAPARSDLYGGFQSGSVIDYGSPSPSYRTSPTASSTSSSSIAPAPAPSGRVGIGRKLLKSFSSGGGGDGKKTSRSAPSSIPFPTRDEQPDILVTARQSRSPSISSTAESVPGVPYSRARLPSFAADGDPRTRVRTSSFCGSSIRTPSVHRTSFSVGSETDRSRRSSGSGTTVDHDPRRDSAGFDSDQSSAAIIRAVKISTSSARTSIAPSNSATRSPSPARQLHRRPSADERQMFLALGEQQSAREKAERQRKAEKQEGKGWLGTARKRANSVGKTREFWAN